MAKTPTVSDPEIDFPYYRNKELEPAVFDADNIGTLNPTTGLVEIHSGIFQLVDDPKVVIRADAGVHLIESPDRSIIEYGYQRINGMKTLGKYGIISTFNGDYSTEINQSTLMPTMLLESNKAEGNYFKREYHVGYNGVHGAPYELELIEPEVCEECFDGILSYSEDFLSGNIDMFFSDVRFGNLIHGITRNDPRPRIRAFDLEYTDFHTVAEVENEETAERIRKSAVARNFNVHSHLLLDLDCMIDQYKPDRQNQTYRSFIERYLAVSKALDIYDGVDPVLPYLNLVKSKMNLRKKKEG